jgi:hypothetical protein
VFGRLYRRKTPKPAWVGEDIAGLTVLAGGLIFGQPSLGSATTTVEGSETDTDPQLLHHPELILQPDPPSDDTDPPPETEPRQASHSRPRVATTCTFAFKHLSNVQHDQSVAYAGPMSPILPSTVARIVSKPANQVQS